MTEINNLIKKTKIRDWWANAPMTYAEDHGHVEYVLEGGIVERVEIGTRRFYELADAVLYRWNEPLHNSAGKFGKIFDYEKYCGKNILEVGCGMGCMASNWALHGANITAIDLNPVAVEKTKKRFELFNLKGEIREVDAEKLPFPDSSFDYIYSWGVIHHTPDIESAAREMFRVLKPGGKISLMLYNRNSLLYRYSVKYIEGFLNFENKFLDALTLASRYGDGGRQEGNPHTWPVTKQEVMDSILPMCSNVTIQTLGTDIPEILNTWLPSMGYKLPLLLRKSLGRRWGWSLWISGEKTNAKSYL